MYGKIKNPEYGEYSRPWRYTIAPDAISIGVLISLALLAFAGCGPDGSAVRPASNPVVTNPGDTDPEDKDPGDSTPADTTPADTSAHSGNYDSAKPVPPEIGEAKASGNVTTYGSLVDPQPSRGGACNYGDTEILNFAAINVNVLPGDGKGQWQGGRACGRCARVEAQTAGGSKSTVVRIVDKCPDDNCGIDLGGLPARTLMGGKPGRYSGSWEWVSCRDQEGVSDGAPSLFVKEGSNPYWSVVQIRNPPGAVLSMSWASSGAAGEFPLATEAENYFKVPQAVLDASGPVEISVAFSEGGTMQVTLAGMELSAERAEYPLGTPP